MRRCGICGEPIDRHRRVAVSLGDASWTLGNAPHPAIGRARIAAMERVCPVELNEAGRWVVQKESP
jgi:hypothetical protein